MSFQYQLTVRFPKYPFSIGYDSSIISFGSCFAQHMGEQLAFAKFPITDLPFGIQYQPLAISKLINMAIDQGSLQAKDLVFDNYLWHSWDFHSDFSAPHKKQVLESTNAALQSVTKHILKADVLLITFGTARVFEHIESSTRVNNCHKFPASHFREKTLNVEQIVTSWQLLIRRLLSLNSNLKIVFTVSPVRHRRGGMVKNQRSKSRLHLAVETLTDTFEAAHYFPAYELFIDELRGYRWFADDLCHPSSAAKSIVWSRFCESFFSEKTQSICKEVEKVMKGFMHRPFHRASPKHQAFIASLEAKKQALQEKHGIEI